MNLLIFNHSNFVPWWTLIVPFIWTIVIDQGSMSYRLSDLRGILSFSPALDHQFYNPIWPRYCLHRQCCDRLGGAYVSQFCSSWPLRACQTAVQSKNSCTQGDFEHCVIGRANGPCNICEKIRDVTLTDSFGHVDFSCMEHPHDSLMHPLTYCIHLWVPDTGRLKLDSICIT
jgi:hypothetical protein